MAEDVRALREKLLRARLAGDQPTGGRVIPRAGRAGPTPLSSGQRRLWFLDALDPDAGEYVVPFVLRLRGVLDADALGRAWLQVQDRHEILRTRYVLAGSEPGQICAGSGGELVRSDLRGTPAGDRASRALELANRLTRGPMPLADGVAARAHLITVTDDEHYLTVSFHHIAFDAWSERVLWRDLAALYRVETGGDVQLEPLPVQYADFAAWQTDRLETGALDDSFAFWERRLASMPPLELPTDRPREAVRSAAGAAIPMTIPAPDADAVRKAAVRCGTTPFVFLLTVFHVLLSRYAGVRDIAVAVPVAGREELEVHDLIGFFVNTVVVRATWADDPVFSDMVQHNRSHVLDAMDYQDIPFDRLVDRLAPERDLSVTPLAQVMFGYQDDVLDEIDLPGLVVERIPVISTGAKLDLNLQLVEGGDGAITGALEYSTALFEPRTAQRMADHFLRLVGSAADDPGCRLSGLTYLSEDEAAEMIAAGHGGIAARRPGAVHELIAEQARRTPKAPAVVTEHGRITFRELDTRANRLARHLLAEGVRPGSIVGVHLPRDTGLVVALLAVLKTGAAYVPLDPNDASSRRATVLADAGVHLLVTDEGGAAALGEGLDGRTAVLVDRDATAVAAQPDTDPRRPVDPESLAYVIYTSGTTGRPKGVMITHRSLVNYLWWTAEEYLRAAGGTALFSSIAFDLVVPNLYTSLMCGRPVHLLPPDVAPAEFGAHLLACGPLSFVKMAPGHLELLAAQFDPEQRRAVAGLVIAAGDRFPSALANDWLADVGPGRLAAEYGPTEITVGNSGYTLDSPIDSELVSIGKPIQNTTAYVLDDAMRPVPVGVVGELYVGGAGVARGYLGKPDLTADRFLPDLFAAEPGARLYRTGDLVCVRPDGELHFVGRVDNQVKIRGYRVEPAEVENVLSLHPAVRGAVVAARDTGAAGQELIGYVLPSPVASRLDQAELRAFAGDRLPAYMVPTAIMVLDAFPLTDVGKIDLAALPSPDRASRAVDTTAVAPRTDREREIAEVWRDVLGADEVGIHDSFFELGGDSVRAVALVGILRREGFEVTVRDVFQHRTVATLVDALGPRHAGGVDGPLVRPFELLSSADRTALPVGVTDAYPLSRIQLGMVLEMEASQEEGNYHNVTSYRIRDPHPYRHEAMQEAVTSVVLRHEVLRTTMDLTTYSEPLQLVHETTDVSVGLVDLRGREPAEQDLALSAYMAAERGRPFDLGVAPLFRFFVHLYDGYWRFTFTEFHPILEGWSFHVLLTEVLDRYRALRDGSQYVATPLPEVRYADFIALERAETHNPGHAAFWADVVDNYPKFELPEGWAGEPGRVRLELVRYHDLLDGLHQLARHADVSMKSVMLAAHLKVLSLLTPEPAFAAGLVCDTRPEVDGADRVAGMYLNTVPFPFRTGAGSWRELVQQVMATEIEVWPHRRYPLGAKRQGGRPTGEVDVDFAYLDFHVLDWDLVDQEGGIDDSPNEFKLQVTAHTGWLQMASRPQDVSPAARRRLAALYRVVLEAMSADPDGDPRRLLVPAQERSIAGPATGPSAREIETSVHGLVEEQVRRTPDALAVIDDRQELSFAEVNDRANRLAHHLTGLGVGPESVVAVHLERSAELVIALLAVLKAGGAFLPFDPEHPLRWRRDALAQAAPAALVTRDRWLDDFADVPVPVVSLERDREALAAAPTADPGLPWHGGDRLAYVIYTSGSTGRPKGAQNTHRGLVNRLLWGQSYLPLVGDDAVLQKTPISFDVSLWEIFWPLVSGGRLVLARPGGHRDPDYLADVIARRRVTVTQFVPSMLAIFLGTPGIARRCGSVRHIVCSGEALSRELRDRTLRELPWVRLHNLYGPAETAIEVTAWACHADDRGEGVPIGPPISHTRTLVCDDDLNPVPYGVTGELFLAGAPVGRGYHAAPGMTADRFGPDPVGPAGARMYRTGDRARMSPDGVVEYLGRRDRQIKLNGVRIEPGQIESVLAEHDAVRDAVVVVYRTDGGESRLVGYVVPRLRAAEPTGEEIRQWCRTRLPAALVPGCVLVIPELPVSRNGKLDRSRLPEPTAGRVATRQPPRTVLELEVLRLWQQVLDTPNVGVEDDFFELGGNSLQSVRLVGAMRRELGVDLSLAALFRHSTVAAQAAALNTTRRESRGAPVRMRTGSGTPTFCLAPMGGTVFCYLDLARGLDVTGPVYGLQSLGLEPGERPTGSIVEIAAAARDAVRDACSDGPVRLLGWSFGAVVAYETARQLAAGGDEVEWLALLDPAVPAALDPDPVAQDDDEPAVMAAYLAYLAGLHEVEVSLDAATLAAMSPAGRRRELVTRMRAAQLLPPDAGNGDDLRFFETYAANWRAQRAYRPGRYAGQTRIFFAQDEALPAREQWLRLCVGDTEVVGLTGDHFAAVRPPNVATVVAALADLSPDQTSPGVNDDE